MPTDLLNRDPVANLVFELKPIDTDSKWSLLITSLAGMVGVSCIRTDILTGELDIAYNERVLKGEEIRDRILASGFAIETVLVRKRTGQSMAIPPNRVV